jgi:hypothetical protein
MMTMHCPVVKGNELEEEQHYFEASQNQLQTPKSQPALT